MNSASLLRKVESALAHHLEVATVPEGLREMMFDPGWASSQLARQLVKVNEWCSPSQRALLRFCEQSSGVELTEKITPDQAAVYVEFLRSETAVEHEQEDIPL